MASIASHDPPRPPYDASDDCSQGICTTYCRQFCYLIFPPPPPPDDDSRPAFSPLIIAIIALLASAFLLVGYYVFVRRYCRRRRSAVEIDENRNVGQDLWRIASPPAGLDEAVIKAIAVCKYRKGDGLIEGTECAVCLGEFRESEALRLLPKCNHAFHAPCIDAWLKSQPNCPLCRATVSSASTTTATSQTSSDPTHTNAYQIQRPEDLVLVVEDSSLTAMLHQEGDTGNPDTGQLRRCVSLGDFPNQRKLLISDILKFEDIDECDLESRSSIGSSRGMKRSISAGRDVYHHQGNT